MLADKMQNGQMIDLDLRTARLFQFMLQRHADEEAAAARQKQEEEIDTSCKIAAKRETGDMRQQIRKLEERLELLEAAQGGTKQKKRPRPISDEDESEEEEAEEPSTVKKKRGRPRKTDKKNEVLAQKHKKAENEDDQDADSIFASEDDGGRFEDQEMRIAKMMGMNKLTSAAEFEEWIELRLKERSDRATGFLLAYAKTMNIDLKGARGRDTIMKRLAPEFEIPNEI